MAWSRERMILWPLVGSVALAVVVLGTILFRSSFQLGALRERSVVEATLSLANDKADRLERKIIEQDNAVRELVAAEPVEQAGRRWTATAPSQTPSVRIVLVVDLGSPDREVVALASRAPGDEDERFRRRFVRKFLPELDLGGNIEELRHLHTVDGDESYLISHFQRLVDGRPYLYVLWHDVPRIVHDIFPTLYRESDGQPSRVNVVDSEGRIVFGPPISRGSLTVGRQFETTLYKWRVNVSMMAAERLAAELEQRRLLEIMLLGLSSAVVLVGLVVLVFASVRERKLAALKSDFVANVSHELKTPLSLVRMFSEMLLSGRAPESKQRQYLEIIVSESERLTALIDNVLDFARVERGKSSYSFSPVAIVETVGRAVDICRPRAERQGVQLDYRPSVDVRSIARVDERAVEIGLVNLVDNALKYASGTREVRVVLARDGGHYVLSVEDDGPGVPVSERKRIFERFVRGKSGTEGSRGSGIGLSLVQHIAEAHGGRAYVGQSESGGARFVMMLRA